MHPICYPALSGIFGAQSILFAKSVAELIKTTAEGTNQFLNFGTYVITLGMFACIFLQVSGLPYLLVAILPCYRRCRTLSNQSPTLFEPISSDTHPRAQIHWLAFGLQSFDAVFVVPVFQCFFISVSIFGGGVYFKEFSKMSALAVRSRLLPPPHPTALTVPLLIIASSQLQLGMFFFGAAVTLSGVYLLSKRDMNSLRPVGKLRAAVKMIIFIKRAQKARNIEHRWVLPAGDCAALCSSPRVAKSAQPKSTVSGLKLSKASVMPVDSSRFPGPTSSPTTIELACCSKREKISDEDAVPRTALDSSYSQSEAPQPPQPPQPPSNTAKNGEKSSSSTGTSNKTHK